MYINDIVFPNQILDAIRDNSLVVFAGAGVSMGEPTQLPSFEKMAEMIAEGTGRKKRNDEPCEVFLGSLNAEGLDVNEIAASLLSSVNLKHNNLHEAIVNLFPSLDQVKIVTTNYDQMFEQVLEDKYNTCPVYSLPAIPLGNDFSGIIHIHGNVSNPRYMVVTDEDFGRAYLTEGSATRFLVKLFQTYTVLFVGYSYKDTIMRYLTRAMYREHSGNRYILTTEPESSWDSLGITAIAYPRERHDLMTNSLLKFGNYANKGFFDWASRFEEIAYYPPKDLTSESEVDYCLETVVRSRIMSSKVHGKEWMNLLDRKGVFTTCFSNTRFMDEKDLLWSNWLSNEFVAEDDYSLLSLIAKHGNSVSDDFSREIINKVILKNEKLSDEFLRKYLMVLDRSLIDPWKIFVLIKIAHERQMHEMSLYLFEKFYDLSVDFEKRIWPQDGKWEPKHSFIGDYYAIIQSWELISESVLSNNALAVLSFVERTIEKIHYLYAEMGCATSQTEPWSISMLIIEDRGNSEREDPILVLVKAFLQAIKLVDNEQARFFIRKGLSSESILLRKIVLRAMREIDCFSNDETIDYICNESLLWSLAEREQVFLLAKKMYVNASMDKQNEFLNLILKGPTNYHDERNRKYEIYNWCVWLKKNNCSNNIIDALIFQLENEHGFTPREFPEQVIIESEVAWIKEESPVSLDEMLKMSPVDLVSILVTYKEDFFEKPSQRALLRVFSNAVKKDSQWAYEIADILLNDSIINGDIWNFLFDGIVEANLSIDEAINWCKEIQRIIGLVPDVKCLAYFLWKVLQRDDIQTVFNEWNELLFNLSLELWNRRDRSDRPTLRLIDKTLNTTTGIVLLCWIYMVSHSITHEIPEQYKQLFGEAIQLNTWEQEVAICILAGHFNFLCYRDKTWCINLFEPMLIGNDKHQYVSAWEGITYYSRRINVDTADIVAPLYLKAVEHINWLEGETKHNFIELYLTLTIYVIEKPIMEYIPAIYRFGSEDTIIDFIKSICFRLKNMELESKKKWWNNWLKTFISNRKINKPIKLTDSECSALFMLLPQLDFALEEAIDILCKGSLPVQLNNMFWYELNEMNLAINNTHSVVKLIVTLLNSIGNVKYESNYIVSIVSTLTGLEEDEINQLQEVLLKHGINLCLR